MKSAEFLSERSQLDDKSASTAGLSGREKGEFYFRQVSEYLTAKGTFPLGSDGAIAVSLLADELNVPTQSMYKNRNIRDLLDSESRRLGLAPIGSHSATKETTHDALSSSGGSRLLESERRVHKLEQQNAAMIAENSDLRQQLKVLRLSLAREDMTIETGRRVADPQNYS